MNRLVVVGASLAGLRAVESARKSGYTGDVTLIGAEHHLPYDRPQLSKAFLAADAAAAVTPYRSAEELRDDFNVEVLLGEAAEALDSDARVVTVGGREVPYDGLVIATGAASRGLPDIDEPDGVYHLRTADDALALRAAFEGAQRVVVVGAGFIGSEVASAARARGLDVTVIEAARLPLTRSVGPDVGEVCVRLHRENGTQVRLGQGVNGFESDAAGHVTGVRLAGGEVVPADVVVLGLGVAPATGWLQSSDLALHERDHGVLCDATLATNLPGVYAAGDVAHVVSTLFDNELMRLEHWTSAAEQGAAAARHATDPASAKPLNTVPYFWSDWYGHRLQFVGTPKADEVVVAQPSIEGFTALYRRGDRMVGALTIDRPRDVMKLRRSIVARSPWGEVAAQAA